MSQTQGQAYNESCWNPYSEKLISLVRNRVFCKLLLAARLLILPPTALERENVKAACKPCREKLASDQNKFRGLTLIHK